MLRGGPPSAGATVRQLPTPAQLAAIAADVAEIVELALRNSVVRDRFTGTAVLGAEQVRDIGALGYVARASGVDIDARRDHPFHDATASVSAVTDVRGDVLARFLVRAGEVQASVALLNLLLAEARSAWLSERPQQLTGEPDVRSRDSSRAGAGTIAHRVELDADGRLTRVKIVDPSFFNWPALPVALADTIVPDFPLANKSFNLSYAGNDRVR